MPVLYFGYTVLFFSVMNGILHKLKTQPFLTILTNLKDTYDLDSSNSVSLSQNDEQYWVMIFKNLNA